MRLILALLMAAVLASAAWGQPSSTNASALKQPRAISVPPVEVPPDLARRGVQGELVLRGMVQPDGTITDVEIVETSHSPELDAFAKSILLQVTFEPASVDGVKVAAPYENAIALHKDHAATLHTKTCADLNIDLDYFRTTFPDRPVKEIRVATMSLGLYGLNYRGSKTVEWYKHAAAAFEKTVPWCAEHPSDLFFESFVRMAK